jgi:acyl carrier protein
MESTSPPALKEFLLDIIATGQSIPRAELGLETQLVEANLDSLALAAIVGHVEAVYGVEFATDDVGELLAAASIGDLIASLERAMRGSTVGS